MADSSIAFSAEVFRAQTGKPASPSQYLVTLSNTPIIMSGVVDEFFLSMAAQTAEIPARQLDVLERRYNGPVRNVPVGHTYSTMNIEYFETSDYNIRNFFNTWQDRIFKESETWKVPFYQDIIAEYLDIDLFGPDGRKMSTYRIYEVFPISVSSTQLGWGLMNQSMTTNIEFSYHRWEELDIKRSAKKEPAKEKEPTGLLGLIKNAGKNFGSFVKTVKTIKSNVDFVKKTVKNVKNTFKEIKALRINTNSLGGFVASLDNIGNVGSAVERRINNFGSGRQRIATRNKETFNKFTE